MTRTHARPLLVVGAGALGIGILARKLAGTGHMPELLVRSSNRARHDAILHASEAGLSVTGPRGDVERFSVNAIDGNDEGARHEAYRRAGTILVSVGAGSAERAIIEIAEVVGEAMPPLLVCENLSRSAREEMHCRLKNAAVPMSRVRYAISFDVAKIDPSAPEIVEVLHEEERLIVSRKASQVLQSLADTGMVSPVSWFDFAETCKFMLQLAIYDGISCLAAARGLHAVPPADDDPLCLWTIVERASAATLSVLSQMQPSQAQFAQSCRQSALKVARQNAPRDDLVRNVRNIERKLGEDERFRGPASLIERAGETSQDAVEIFEAAKTVAERDREAQGLCSAVQGG